MKAGEILARIYTTRSDRVEDAMRKLLESYVIGEEKTAAVPLVYEIILGETV